MSYLRYAPHATLCLPDCHCFDVPPSTTPNSILHHSFSLTPSFSHPASHHSNSSSSMYLFNPYSKLPVCLLELCLSSPHQRGPPSALSPITDTSNLHDSVVVSHQLASLSPCHCLYSRRLHVWFSEPGFCLPSVSSIAMCLPSSSLPLCPSAPLTSPSSLPLPVPHLGSLFREVQPGTQQGTRTGSCLACFHSAHGHRAAARGGTRPRLRAQTGRLTLGQTPLPPPPAVAGNGEGKGGAKLKPEPGWAGGRGVMSSESVD